MATPASFEASEIRRRGRRRLIGAVAIVVLLVVFVPMLLDSEPRPSRNAPELAIPSKENAPPLPAPAPAPAPQAVQTKPVAPSTAPAAAATPPSAAATPPSPATPPSEPPAVARITPSTPAKAPAPKLEGFAVQVGAFRDEATLQQARDKLAAAGIAHYTERLDAKSGGLTRLRAGPFRTRDAAEAALAKVHKAALDGQVVPLP